MLRSFSGSIRRQLATQPELVAAVAALLVAFGARRGFGRYDVRSLALVTLGTVAALVATRRSRSSEGTASRTAETLLAACLALFAAGHALVGTAPGLAAPWGLRIAAILAAAFAASYLLAPPAWVVRVRFTALVALFVVGAASVILAREPLIDVWSLQQDGAAALLAGENPYSVDYPSPYPDAKYFGPGVLANGRITSFPYPPATLAWDVPFFAAFGDVRFGTLLAAVLAALGLRRLGGRRAELAALVVLWQPTTFFVLGEAWTEPTVTAAWVLALLALRRPADPSATGRDWTSGLALGLAASMKQYTPLVLLPLAFALPARRLPRLVVAGGAVVAALMLPFALWDGHELVRDVVRMQIAQPFRLDALSLTAFWARTFGGRPSALFGFAAAAVVLGLELRPRLTLERAALVSGATFLVFVLLNKQAFCNYYWLAANLLLTALALGDTVGRRESLT